MFCLRFKVYVATNKQYTQITNRNLFFKCVD